MARSRVAFICSRQNMVASVLDRCDGYCWCIVGRVCWHTFTEACTWGCLELASLLPLGNCPGNKHLWKWTFTPSLQGARKCSWLEQCDWPLLQAQPQGDQKIITFKERTSEYYLAHGVKCIFALQWLSALTSQTSNLNAISGLGQTISCTCFVVLTHICSSLF